MQNIKVLLVDDEPDYRNAIAKRLNKRGVQTDQAENGEACLRYLENERPDVVVMDVKMPGIDGIETLRRIKETYPAVEVILLTGHAAAQDGVEGIKSGAFDYLTKPVELEHLRSKIFQAYEKMRLVNAREEEKKFREQMEQQMIAAERLASLGTLAAGVAHEINNPLAIIGESAGWMRLLLNKAELESMPRKADFINALDKIDKGVVRARKITHQLLGVVRKQDSAFSEIDLKELIEEATGLVHREAMYKGIDIIITIDPAAKIIWTDPYQLRQVLINLMTNAIHATDFSGKIFIACQSREKNIVLSVKDIGRGIPKENMEKIFEPFFTTKNPGEGTGLGLFVTRGIIEKLGGKIEVKSVLGKGAEFVIQLPKYQRNPLEKTTI